MMNQVMVARERRSSPFHTIVLCHQVLERLSVMEPMVQKWVGEEMFKGDEPASPGLLSILLKIQQLF